MEQILLIIGAVSILGVLIRAFFQFIAIVIGAAVALIGLGTLVARILLVLG